MTFGQTLRAVWEEIAPDFSYGYDRSGLERWDGKGEGPCRHIGFEGFGLSFSLFFGRMPPKQVDLAAPAGTRETGAAV
ncbi:hypothetical protein FSB78_10005 [Sphingomonas ginsenosidivorax]|uniref:Uncharacterized protein n=1 Tax=Sphingomonas ginsenosidivorax TaxID=862135 RepID=A0A5C6UEP1_9SPHN|nr:hypothetical protein [Sphingomonas ginsenosidivorax]TXC71243.1 hypothetical protein FSB78_10005 [Sphingomonas ginsenosidivorax]